MPKVKSKPSSGNVFADIGISDPEEYLAKADIAHEIALSIKKHGLTQTQAARRLGISQPKISLLTRGLLDGFSLSTLMTLAKAIGKRVSVVVEDQQSRSEGSLNVKVSRISPDTPAHALVGGKDYFAVESTILSRFDNSFVIPVASITSRNSRHDLRSTYPAYIASKASYYYESRKGRSNAKEFTEVQGIR